MVKRKKLTVSMRTTPALTITRASIGKNKLVYVLVANKKLKYQYGRSKIAYIGTTRKGTARIAASAAARADSILGEHGVRSVAAHVVTCKPRKNLKTWIKLERALLLTFRELYGEVPWENTVGKGIREKDEFSYFTRSRLKKILEELGE